MFSIERPLWGCVALSILTLVTSFNLKEPSNKNGTSTTPATELNATTIATDLNATTIASDLNATTIASNSTSLNGTSTNSTGELDDRFNFNLNLAGSRGVSKYGGVSQSNALSYGVNSGIRGPGGQVHNLYSNSGSKSSGYSYGPGAPLTYANTATRARPGYGYGGNASAGVQGGKGSSYAQSINHNIEIPLDNKGTVFFSNLKERDNGTSTEASPSSSTSTSPSSSSTDGTSTSTTASSGNKNSGALVFS